MHRSRNRLAYALLVPAGVLAGHQVSHAAASGPHGHDQVPHGYISMAGKGAVALAAVAVLRAVLDRGVLPNLRFRRLLVVQWAAFAVQETVEHLVAGHGPDAVLRSPALWVGILCQLGAAAGTALLVRSAASAGTRLLGAVRPLPPSAAPASFLPAPARDGGARMVRSTSTGPRAPPVAVI